MNDDERTSSPSKAEQLAQDAMAEVSREETIEQERSEAEAQPKSGPGQYVVMTIVLLLLALLIGLNFAGRMPFQVVTPTVSEDELQHNLRVALNYAVRRIESYRLANDRYPANLAEIGGSDQAGWTFALTEGGYRIAVSEGPVTVEYDSSQDADAFFADVRQR